jgi:hypothetical protein
VRFKQFFCYNYFGIAVKSSLAISHVNGVIMQLFGNCLSRLSGVDVMGNVATSYLHPECMLSGLVSSLRVDSEGAVVEAKTAIVPSVA